MGLAEQLVESNEMDGTFTVGQVADRLGLSAPTVRRKAAGAGITPARTAGGHRRFTSAEFSRLAAAGGVTPKVDGLSRSEVRVLATLAARPLGVRSVRSVARVAGLSPTTAGKVLGRLRELGLVRSDTEVVAEGAATEVTVWRLRPGLQWLQVAPAVAPTVLPQRDAEPSDQRPPTGVPRRFWHLFWNVDPSQLTIQGNSEFIAARMVLGGDPAARAWAFRTLPPRSLAGVARLRGADARTRALITNALASAP